MEANTQYDVIVIGGGPAGMAAALEAQKRGSKVLILERNDQLGGILPQCIHNGFGAINFGNDLPGPEYAWRYEQEVRKAPIDVLLETMVVDMTPELDLYAINEEEGYLHYKPRAIVLAMGCRERTRAQIRIPGTRAAGIFTAGTVQRLVNIEGYMPGKRVIILGSGDIGMIMARRLTIEGANVLGVLELMPYLTGLRRNSVQCLQDYGIPLRLSTTVKRIIGKRRVEAIETVKVDPQLNQIEGTEEIIPCDTLVLSVGLIPENELSMKADVTIDVNTRGPVIDSAMATNVPGVYAAGNVTGIYDLVDYVSKAGETAGRSAAEWAKAKKQIEGPMLHLRPGANVGMLLPQDISLNQESNEELLLMLRPNAMIEQPVKLRFKDGDNVLLELAERYARPSEMIIKELKARHIEKLTANTTGSVTLELS